MSKTKFSILMQELSKLLKHDNLSFSGRGALVLRYETTSCRVEDASNVGLHGRIILLVSLEESDLDAHKALDLNGDCYVTLDGYIATYNNMYYYIRTINLPDHPRILLTEIKNTVGIAMKMIHRLKS